MDPSESAQRRFLHNRWEAFKTRYGIAAFVDDAGQRISEGTLTDTDKRCLMDETVTDDTPDRAPRDASTPTHRALAARRDTEVPRRSSTG